MQAKIRTPPGRARVILCAVLAAGGAAACRNAARDDATRIRGTVASRRVFAARLSAQTQYVPVASVRRGPPAADSDAADRDIALALAESHAQREKAADAESLLGQTLLVMGEPSRAVDVLAAVAARRGDGEAYADLAAAYLAAGSASGAQQSNVRALDAALKSLRVSPRLPQAVFNAALSLEANHLDDGAAKMWDRYLAVDGHSGWAAEARARLASRNAPPPWDVLRASLMISGRAADDVLAEAVRFYPQEARALAEDSLLPSWANGDPVTGCGALTRAREIASRLATQLGDGMLAREVTSAAGRAGCPRPTAAVREALTTYRDARQLMAAAQYDRAERTFARGARLLSASGNPLASWALAHQTYAEYQTQHLPAAAEHVRRLERSADARQSHSLSARALWLHALIVRDEGRTDEALRLTSSALASYERADEPATAGAVASVAADIARTAGDLPQAWRLIARAVATINLEPSPVRRYLCFFNASLFARHDGLTDAALVFQDEALKTAPQVTQDGAVAQAFGQRAYLYWLLENPAAARRDLVDARAALARQQGSTTPYLRAELDTIEAAVSQASDPARAITLLTGAAAVYERLAPEQVADVQLAIGRIQRLGGHPDAAERAFSAGVDWFERQRRRITDEDLRISYFGTVRDLYSELIRLEIDRSKTDAAFQVSDRARARALVDLVDARPAAGGVSPNEVARALGPATALLEFTLQDDRLFAWVIRQSGTTFRSSRIDARSLAGAAAALTDANADSATVANVASTLYDVLIAPVRNALSGTDHLLVSPDGALYGVPFAALFDASRHRYLVEDQAVELVPSAAWFVEAVSASGPQFVKARGADAPGLLAIGNPSFDAARHPGLQSLPAAAREARAVAAMYPGGQALVGAAATRHEIARRLRGITVLHLATHAVVNAAAPDESYLLLAPSSPDDDGRLRVADIAALDLRTVRLVVLGACSSAAGPVRFGEGAMTIARPFLAAGARGVVGALWDIDDESAAAVMTRLHGGLLQGLSSADALRAAQLDMIRSSSPRDRDVREWGAFVAIGTGTLSSRTPARQEIQR